MIATGYHDHIEMDVVVGLTFVLPLSSPYPGVHLGINLGGGGGGGGGWEARVSFHYLRGLQRLYIIKMVRDFRFNRLQSSSFTF